MRSIGQTGESVWPSRPGLPCDIARQTNLPWIVGLQSSMGRTYPRVWWLMGTVTPDEITIRRPIEPHKQPVLSFELCVFGDRSTHGVRAVVYSVLHQEDGITQTLVAAKARLAKRNLTVPKSLKDLPEPTVYGWFDSTVTLHWILGNGLNQQFVTKRTQKIKQHPQIQWKHVPTSDNPADLASWVLVEWPSMAASSCELARELSYSKNLRFWRRGESNHRGA